MGPKLSDEKAHGSTHVLVPASAPPQATVDEVDAHVRRFKDHDRANESLLVFGNGDGGGGPTAEMCEVCARP